MLDQVFPASAAEPVPFHASIDKSAVLDALPPTAQFNLSDVRLTAVSNYSNSISNSPSLSLVTLSTE